MKISIKKIRNINVIVYIYSTTWPKVKYIKYSHTHQGHHLTTQIRACHNLKESIQCTQRLNFAGSIDWIDQTVNQILKTILSSNSLIRHHLDNCTLWSLCKTPSTNLTGHTTEKNLKERSNQISTKEARQDLKHTLKTKQSKTNKHL